MFLISSGSCLVDTEGLEGDQKGIRCLYNEMGFQLRKKTPNRREKRSCGGLD